MGTQEPLSKVFAFSCLGNFRLYPARIETYPLEHVVAKAGRGYLATFGCATHKPEQTRVYRPGFMIEGCQIYFEGKNAYLGQELVANGMALPGHVYVGIGIRR